MSVGTGGGTSPWEGQSAKSASSFATMSARSKSPLTATTKFAGWNHRWWKARRSSAVIEATLFWVV